MRFVNWVNELMISFLRPRKKAMRLDVRMKRLAAPYPRNIHKRKNLAPDNQVLREMLLD